MARGIAREREPFILVDLSGCLTTTMVAHAAARGIEIRKVESRYEGDIDLRGFLSRFRFNWRSSVTV